MNQEGFYRRSFATGSGIALAKPTMNVLEIELDTYVNSISSLEFEFFGKYEELAHNQQVQSGHIRNLRLLERDSKEILTSLITEQEDLRTVKEVIVQNERACEHLQNGCERLVKTVDQYAVQAIIEESETELAANTDSDNYLASKLGRQQLTNRGTVANELYGKLVSLENKFGTWLIPRLAGFLALNIPLVSLENSPAMRAEQLAKVNFKDRFERIYEVLIHQSEVAPNISTVEIDCWDEESHQELHAFLTKVMSELDIEVTFPTTTEVSLPLLDIPRQHAPSFAEIEQELQEENELEHNSPVDHDVLADVFTFFTSFGCIILSAKEPYPDYYVPNLYIIGEKTGTGYYIQELFESIFANNIINQLIHQSVTGTVAGLKCPFCNKRHDPRAGNCTWNAFLGDTAKTWAKAERWPAYGNIPASTISTFVTTEVPGEDELAASRNRRSTY